MGYRLFRREWRSAAAMWIVMLAELGATVGLLVVFALAQPDGYRSMLWQAGYELGFNSSPNVLVFAQANGEPAPTLPFVWSQQLTDFNVAISVISLFFLLTKLIAFIMDVWFPIIALFFNTALVALYTTSVYGQAGPDYLDPNRPSPTAWYIAKSCSVSPNAGVQRACGMVKGTFALTVIMLAICVTSLALNIWAMLPNEADQRDYRTKNDDEDDDFRPTGLKTGPQTNTWEMQGIPATPRTGTVPYTPRTMAFNTLERKLPLRQGYA